MEAYLEKLAEAVGHRLLARQALVATAESCTGGWIAQVLTSVPGSSLWFDRGFVTYSNQAKQEMLGVAPETLAAHGAVSAPVVAEMVVGALSHSQARVTLAVTGIAGPGGGSEDKPVGTVYLAWAWRDQVPLIQRRQFAGDREAVRRQTVRVALERLIELLDADG
ncbi:MAG: nicotinamide-nucleotide amidase [Chromatiaceae bacterium]|nr:nicotinamide-nucleotide amidase [Chromatiaceae bacterium]